jgi:hypothetical protein
MHYVRNFCLDLFDYFCSWQSFQLAILSDKIKNRSISSYSARVQRMRELPAAPSTRNPNGHHITDGKVLFVSCAWNIYSCCRIWLSRRYSWMSSLTQVQPHFDIGCTYGALFIGCTIAALLVKSIRSLCRWSWVLVVVVPHLMEQAVWSNQHSNFYLLSDAYRQMDEVL